MKKNILISLIAFSSFLYSEVNGVEREMVASIIPGSKIEKIDHTPIDGLYIVLLENKKFLYVYPYKKIIFFGELLTNKGQNISKSLRAEMLRDSDKERLTKLLKNNKILNELKESSIKVKYNRGSVRYSFFLFTDPDCPFCRRVESLLASSNVDVNYILNPLENLHPKSFFKSQQLISHKKDFSKILEDIRLDNNLTLSVTKESKESLLKMKSLTKKIDISATPTLLVFDENKSKIIDLIEGAMMKKIKKYLKENDDEK